MVAWKSIEQRSLADACLTEHKSIKKLDDVHSFINWATISRLLETVHCHKRGAKAWPPLMMLKALFLQTWYTLSDPQLEDMLGRDLMFRRFVGLSLSDQVPDHSTFWRFRNSKEMLDLYPKIFKMIEEQLEEEGLKILHGEISIIDASVIKAQRNRSKKNKKGENTQDPEGGYNVKNGSDGKKKSTYGYKAHINVDEDGFIKNLDYTSGEVHDSNCFIDLLTGNEVAVYADSAYASEKTAKRLKKKGVENKVLERAYRNKPLTDKQKKSNKIKSRIRSTVERVFGVLKLHYGMSQARYLGKRRNRTRFELMSICYNIKRGVNVLKELSYYRDSCV